MSDRHDNNLNEQQRLAQDALRSLPRPTADAEFRARLKSQFMAGAIEETPLSDSNAEAGTRRLYRLSISCIAAAAILTAVMLGFNSLPGPDVLATNSIGTVTIDGREIPAENTAVIGEALIESAHVQVGEGASLDIVYPGSFALRLGPGTDVVLPNRPGRWFNRSVEAQMDFGEISVRTGPDLSGGNLVIRTEEGRAVIHGTLVSVLRNDAVTCVCLFEGSTDILTEKAELGAIPLGMRWVLFRDGSEPQLMEIVPAHRDHMLGLDATLGGVFETD
jgi:FecR protein